MNVSRERESRERKSSSRRGTRNAKLSGGRSANFPRSFDAASCNFQRAPPTFGYYYSSTLETSKRVGGAQIRRLITNESERGEAYPNRIALLLPPSIIRGINLRKLGEIGEEKLAVRERERDLKGEKKKNCSGRRVVTSWYLVDPLDRRSSEMSVELGTIQTHALRTLLFSRFHVTRDATSHHVSFHS